MVWEPNTLPNGALMVSYREYWRLPRTIWILIACLVIEFRSQLLSNAPTAHMKLILTIFLAFLIFDFFFRRIFCFFFKVSENREKCKNSNFDFFFWFQLLFATWSFDTRSMAVCERKTFGPV